jgi:hypothetical protein
MPAGVAEMSRPKKRTEPVRPPQPESMERETIINMKGSRAYSEWLESVHRKTHIPKVVIFRLALAEWAERNGHESPPEL